MRFFPGSGSLGSVLTAGVALATSSAAVGESPQIRWQIGGHASGVSGVAYSPDGRFIGSTGTEGTLKLWDRQTGALLRTFVGNHLATSPFMTALEFTPDSQFVIGTGEGVGWRWNLESGMLAASYVLLGEGVADLAVSSDSETVVLAGGASGGDETVTVHDYETGDLRYDRIVSFESQSATEVVFLAGDQQFVVGTAGGELRYHRTSDGALLNEVAIGAGSINKLRLSPDAALLAVANSSGPISLRNAATGALVRTIGAGVIDNAETLAFSPDGLQLVSGGVDRILRVWSVSSGTLLRTLGTEDHIVAAIEWSEDGQRVLAGVGQFGSFLRSAVRERSAADGQNLRTITQLTGLPSSLALSEGSGLLAMASGDRIDLRSAATGALVRSIPSGFFFVESVDITSDGALVAGSTIDFVRIFRTSDGALVRELDLAASGGAPDLAFSDNGQLIARGVGGGAFDTTEVYRVFDGALLHTLQAHGAQMDFAPASTRLALAGAAATLWDAATGQFERFFPVGFDFVRDIDFSPDGAFIATGQFQGRLALWNANTGALHRDLTGHSGEVNCLTFSGDGTLLAAATGDRTLGLWDVTTGERIASYDADVGTRVHRMVATPDNRTFIFSRNDAALVAIANPAAGMAGDTNCDGVVTVADIGPFVLALTDPAAYIAQFPNCSLLSADVNADSIVTVTDIGPFVQLLTGR